MLRRGALVPLPEASFLGLPTRLGALVVDAALFWPAKAAHGAEVVRRGRIGTTPTNRSAASCGGASATKPCDYLAEPLLPGIHAGDVEQLSIHALFPRLVELERTHGSVLRGLLTARAAAVAQRRVRVVARRPRGARRGDAGPGARRATVRYDAAVARLVAAADPTS